MNPSQINFTFLKTDIHHCNNSNQSQLIGEVNMKI